MTGPRERQTQRQGLKGISTLLLSIATFNVLGLSDHAKRYDLAKDCYNYNIDILAIQETKCIESEDIIVYVDDNGDKHQYRLIIFEQKHGKTHAGLGFMINCKLLHCFTSYGKVSERITFADFVFQSKNGTARSCRFVNCYGETTPNAKKKPELLVQFYKQLTAAVSIPANHDLYIMGDLNARLGRRTGLDESCGYSKYVGSFGKGARNPNGEALLGFMIINGLYATNTSFQHSSRHITTHTGRCKDWSAGKNSKKTVPYYNQIDYILCRSRQRCMFNDSRSYGGTFKKSDHKLVVARIAYSRVRLGYKKPVKRAKRFDCANLISDKDTQSLYKQAMREKLAALPSVDNANDEMNNLFKVVRECAEETVGFKPSVPKPNFYNDPVVVGLSEERKRLTLMLNADNKSEDRSTLRAMINRSQKLITRRLKELNNNAADSLADQITNTDSSRRMFEAVRSLAKIKKCNSITVHDSNGNMIANDDAKAALLKEFYEKKFTAEDVTPLECFDGPPRPLDIPLTVFEVEKASRALKNGRATGPDGIPSELMKYADPVFYGRYAECINNSLATNTTVDVLGEGIITPLQKPKKEKGPPETTRPLTLSNCSRKTLSAATLNRIRLKVDRYTGSCQSGYKMGRSCSDIVWSQRMMLAVVMRKEFEYYKLDIDMSSAFDTIKRDVVLNVLADAGCTDDELRLVRLLISNTQLKVDVNGTLSLVFESIIGAFQGDCLSGDLFTIILAAALHHLRAILSQVAQAPYVVNHPIPNPPIAASFMPLETQYSDDTSFSNCKKEPLEDLYPVCKKVFGEWNLSVNDSKSEHLHFYLAQPKPQNRKKLVPGVEYRGDEPWRKHKVLGSILCSVEDVKKKCILGNIAYANFKNVWSKNNISFDRKLKVYEAQVVSIMLYNCDSWAAPNHVLEHLDVTHRNHLRDMIGVKWPRGYISNAKLYERCETRRLSLRVYGARWRMLGHVLRFEDDTPAYLAIKFCIFTEENKALYKGRRGAPCMNLLNTFRKDLEKRKIINYLETLSDLENLRVLALDKIYWSSLSFVNLLDT